MAEEARNPAGLKNRGEVSVDCADCGAQLMTILIVRNNADLAEIGASPVTTQLRCACGICGGKSYVQTVEGQFYPGAAADDIAFEVQEPDGEVVVFKAWRQGAGPTL